MLAGGESRRFGSDKLSALVAGQALLERTVAGLPADWAVVVVGPERNVGRPARFVREEPPGGGPTSGMVTGLTVALDAGAEVVVVLPGDAPAAGPAAVRMHRALTASPSVEAIVGVDATGFEQPLQLALRRSAAADLVAFAGDSGGQGARARTLVNQLGPAAQRMVLSVEDYYDIDTAGQLASWTAWHSDAVRQILAVVDERRFGGGQARPGRPVVVALDGRSGAGKSVLAAGLALARPATVVEGDDFYAGVARLAVGRDVLGGAELADQVFDWLRLRTEALVPLSRGETARYSRYDWAADDGRLAATVELSPGELVVVEGVYSARPELSDLVDVAVLVEVGEDIRQRRLAARPHDHAELVSLWERGESYYFGHVRPRDSYDLVVSSLD